MRDARDDTPRTGFADNEEKTEPECDFEARRDEQDSKLCPCEALAAKIGDQGETN